LKIVFRFLQVSGLSGWMLAWVPASYETTDAWTVCRMLVLCQRERRLIVAQAVETESRECASANTVATRLGIGDQPSQPMAASRRKRLTAKLRSNTSHSSSSPARILASETGYARQDAQAALGPVSCRVRKSRSRTPRVAARCPRSRPSRWPDGGDRGRAAAGQGPGECQGEVVLVGRLFIVGKPKHRSSKESSTPRVNVESKVQVDGSTANPLRVQVDLPNLAEGVRLRTEVALVVHVKAMVNRVILQIGARSRQRPMAATGSRFQLSGRRAELVVPAIGSALWTTLPLVEVPI